MNFSPSPNPLQVDVKATGTSLFEFQREFWLVFKPWTKEKEEKVRGTGNVEIKVPFFKTIT